jgi:hypothetical protein
MVGYARYEGQISRCRLRPSRNAERHPADRTLERYCAHPSSDVDSSTLLSDASRKTAAAGRFLRVAVHNFQQYRLVMSKRLLGAWKL